MNLATIVGHVGGRCKGESEEQAGWHQGPVKSKVIKKRARAHVAGMLKGLDIENDTRTLDQVEQELIGSVGILARLLITFHLARREEENEKRVESWVRRGFRRCKKQRKFVNTIFGRVCFWRTYVRRGEGKGLHPLDKDLEITADGFSRSVLSMAARLSTLVPYEQVTALMLYFLSWSPSKTTVEKSVLGFGRFTQEWFAEAPAPDNDGEVLITQIDCKATPTATEEELEKRRGKRERKPALSPRHRGRAKRARRGERRRRKKGDKSKNGKAATVVIQYTLKIARDDEGESILLGPRNKRVYASYAPKRHAFAVARREADKRGFTKESGKRHQVVTDGDEDFERLTKEFFPEATHTLDIIHVLEYVWEAGRFRHREESKELARWVKKQEKLLYDGKAALVVQHICDLKREVKKACDRLDKIRMYLQNRLSMMKYDELRKEDLEVASGVVEGGVRHIVAKRFDNGSMRWIRERAEALLQLRCIEINGDWEAFEEFVRRRLWRSAPPESIPRLLTTKPQPLPPSDVNPCNQAA